MGVGNGSGTVMGSQWDWEHLWFLFPGTDMMGSKLRGLIEFAGPVSMEGELLPNQVPLQGPGDSGHQTSLHPPTGLPVQSS